jgi:UDP-N-acetylglucosamine acyltransferase
MIHPLSSIHPDAKIANNATIDPFAFIDKNVEIGEGTHVMSNAVVLEGARIGKNCTIFPGAVVSGIPQDLKYAGEETTAIIGDNTAIRENVTVNRGTKAKGKTIVGSNCLLMAYVHIAHDCIIGNGVIVGNGTQLGGEVEIGNMAILSAHVLVHQFTKIGSHVMISGGSHVLKDVPPFVKAAREPVSYVGINSVGLRRRNYSREAINEIQEMFRVIYQRGFNNSEAVKFIEENFQSSIEKDEILNFIKNSKRGIMKGYTPTAGVTEEEEYI